MNNNEKTYLNIKSWAEEDRPREKLLAKGQEALSDAELIAILIGSGSREETAVDLSKRILKNVQNDLNSLGRCSLAELMKFKGIGEAKAISIAAALELGRRRQLTDIKERPVVQSSNDAYQAIAPLLMDKMHEEFWVLLLNRANKIIGREMISTGGVAGTVVDVKMVFKKAIEVLASSIILVHNHPSGNLKPSQADLDLTKRTRLAGDCLDIKVLDHLIIAGKRYLSFADENIL